MVRGIEDTCHQLRLVAHAEESRHVGLNHHFLLCHSLSADESAVHILCRCNTHEAPCGQALWQRKLDGDASLAVRCQRGIEEGRLVQVLTHLDATLLVGCRLVFVGRRRRLYRPFLYHRLCCHRHHNGASVFGHDGIARQPALGCTVAHDNFIHSILIVVGEAQESPTGIVEVAEFHVLHLERFPQVLGPSIEATPTGASPEGVRRRYIYIRCKRPVVAIELFERLVVHRRHELCVCRRAVRVRHHEFPLFLLTRCQTVAEGFPAQRELLVGHRALDGRFVRIELAVLYPRKGEQQARAVRFLVGELLVPEGVALVHGTTLYDGVTRNDAIHHVHVVGAGAYLYSDG